MKKQNKIKNIIYTAGVIIDNTPDRVFNYNAWPNKYVDHMTIQYGGLKKKPAYIGKLFTFIATHAVSDEKGVAWLGHIDDKTIEKKMKEIGQHAHVTLFTAEGVGPVYSNELMKTAQWHKLARPVAIKMMAGMFVAYEDGSTGWEF